MHSHHSNTSKMLSPFQHQPWIPNLNVNSIMSQTSLSKSNMDEVLHIVHPNVKFLLIHRCMKSENAYVILKYNSGQTIGWTFSFWKEENERNKGVTSLKLICNWVWQFHEASRPESNPLWLSDLLFIPWATLEDNNLILNIV